MVRGGRLFWTIDPARLGVGSQNEEQPVAIINPQLDRDIEAPKTATCWFWLVSDAGSARGEAMGIINPQLDRDIEASRVETRAAHLAGIIKAKLASGNWVAGVLVVLIVGGAIGLGLLRESWYYHLHAQTCHGVLVSGLDQGKLEFLGKHCTPK